MRPSVKFLKHTPRGLKHLKRTAMESMGTGLQETIQKVESEAKKLTPLRFKSRT